MIVGTRLIPSSPSEGPKDRKYHDILLQGLSLEYQNIRRPNLERQAFGVADIRSMIAVIHTDNITHQSIASEGIVTPGMVV